MECDSGFGYGLVRERSGWTARRLRILGLMRASTSRLVYCIGLLVVTACAVLPEAMNAPVGAASTAAPLSAEARLAHTIRDRIELTAVYGEGHPRLQETATTEAALRELAFSDDIAATRRDLISALANELSDALANRSKLAAEAAEPELIKPELIKADAVVSGLTAAINTEVHRNRV